MKKTMKPATLLMPLPAVMVSCGSLEKPNIITIAWTGIVNSTPPMTYISVRKSRYSHDLIAESGDAACRRRGKLSNDRGISDQSGV